MRATPASISDALDERPSLACCPIANAAQISSRATSRPNASEDTLVRGGLRPARHNGARTLTNNDCAVQCGRATAPPILTSRETLPVQTSQSRQVQSRAPLARRSLLTAITGLRLRSMSRDGCSRSTSHLEGENASEETPPRCPITLHPSLEYCVLPQEQSPAAGQRDSQCYDRQRTSVTRRVAVVKHPV
jgi:hypothetical protein